MKDNIDKYENHYVKITTSDEYDCATFEIGFQDDHFCLDEPSKSIKWIDWIGWFIVIMLFLILIGLCFFFLF